MIKFKIFKHLKKLVFPVLVFLVFCFVGVKTYKNFNDSFFNKLARVNLVVTDAKDFNAVFSAEGNTSFLFTFVPTDKIVLARGFGEYRIGKIYSLGELDKKGGELLVQSIQEFWSIPIFGYLGSGSLNEKRLLEGKQGEMKRLVANCIFGNCKTNLGRLNLVILYFNLIKTGNNTIVSKKIGIGEKISFLKDKKIRDEALAIEVLNSTDHAGLAERAKNLIENVGGRAIRLSQSEKPLNNCRIVVKPDLITAYTVGFLKAIYGCDVEKSNEDASSRAEVTLILGEGYWKKVSEKW